MDILGFVIAAAFLVVFFQVFRMAFRFMNGHQRMFRDHFDRALDAQRRQQSGHGRDCAHCGSASVVGARECERCGAPLAP